MESVLYIKECKVKLIHSYGKLKTNNQVTAKNKMIYVRRRIGNIKIQDNRTSTHETINF